MFADKRCRQTPSAQSEVEAGQGKALRRGDLLSPAIFNKDGPLTLCESNEKPQKDGEVGKGISVFLVLQHSSSTVLAQGTHAHANHRHTHHTHANHRHTHIIHTHMQTTDIHTSSYSATLVDEF